MDWICKRSGNSGDDSDTSTNVVRLRGLPFQATKQDIASFFEGKLLGRIEPETDYQ